MENIVIPARADEIKAGLDSCHKAVSSLTREALSPATTATRRIEALMARAALQTKIALLERDLRRFQPGAGETDCGDISRGAQSDPWPRSN